MVSAVALFALIVSSYCVTGKQDDVHYLRTGRHNDADLSHSSEFDDFVDSPLPISDISENWFQDLDDDLKEFVLQKMMTIGGISDALNDTSFLSSLYGDTSQESSERSNGDDFLPDYWNGENDQESLGSDGTRHRSLQAARAFSPLSCNSNVDLATCTSFSSLLGGSTTLSTELQIACGTCITVDISDGSTITLSEGLDIQGKLYFPSAASVTIRTTYVLVQGVLEMDAPSAGNQVKFSLFGTDSISFTPHADNSAECDPTCTVGKKPIAVAGGQLRISGLTDPDCPSWAKLQDLTMTGTVLNQVVVDTDAAECWNVGDTLLLTTPDWDMVNKFETTITSIDAALGVVVTADPVPDVFTLVTELTSDYAVEVASLSRRIIFEAEDDDPEKDGLIGGHLIVYYTPTVVQMLTGVEFVSFGQQGNMGRYPIHFHMCIDSTGSVVSNNVIRKSNQRCVVIHGTDNVNIQNNVAYDTAGHCFFTEDGVEEGNVFEKNLGANIRKPTYLIPGENDNQPATFWITNPTNTWIDNVAAGSEFQGFWFDTRTTVRGESLSLGTGITPVSASLTEFRGNIAHGHKNTGIAFYSPGWRPTGGEQVIENCKSYRNLVQGFFFHADQHIALTGSVIADNYRGVEFFRNGEIRFDDVKIIGFSANYADVLAITGSLRLCRVNHAGGRFLGLEIHPWRLSGSKGLRANNIEFSDFEDDDLCDGFPIHMRILQAWKKVYDSADTFSNILFDGSQTYRADACDAVDDKVTSIALHDLDGTLGPTGDAGFLVSDDAVTTTFANGLGCSSFAEGNCLLFCPQACLRQVYVLASNTYPTDAIEMVVTDGTQTATAGWTRLEWLGGANAQADSSVSLDGYYAMSLPDGNFEVSFRDKVTDVVAFPSYAELVYEEEPQCSGYVTSVSLVRPDYDELRCLELVKEGSFDDGLDAFERFGSWQNNLLSLEFVSPGFGGSGYALKVAGNTGQSSGFAGQWLDVSCFEPWTEYTISAKIYLDGGASCQVGSGGDCPEAKLEFYYGEPVPFRPTTLIDFGLIESGVLVDGWYEMTGTFLFDDTLDTPERVLLRFWQETAVDYMIDDVTISSEKKTAPPSSEPTTSPMPTPILTNLALNKPAEQSSTAHGGSAERANDGNTDPLWDHGSVTHTGGDGPNYWMVDILLPSHISQIKVYNRQDSCCPHFLNNFEVDILDENSEVVQTESFSGTNPTVVEFDFAPLIIGQFVRIRSQTILMLAEVEVFGWAAVETTAPSAPIATVSPMPTPILTNLALNKPAQQSSTAHNSPAERATDGNTDGLWGHGSVTHTGGGNNFWMVDILLPSYISQIKVFNRLDSCCKQFLNSFELDVLDENSAVIHTESFSGNKPTMVEFNFKPLVIGQFVRIRNPTILMLAEVQVFGWAAVETTAPSAPIATISPMPTPILTNIALSKPAEQSSTAHGGSAERANDGNTAPYWRDGSVTHTGGGNNYWMVDLLSVSYISQIKVYNRQDSCCPHYLNSFEVDILDENSEVVQTESFSGSSPTVIQFDFAPLVMGQFVRIRNPTLLMLAEVEVFGWVP